jgi:D-threo-aldose 1-dehydrogenase
MDYRPLGKTGVKVPPIIFGTSALGNLYRALDYEDKREIVARMLEHVRPVVVLDSAGKYGAGLALETIGRILRDLAVEPGRVVISNKLAWVRRKLEAPEPTFEPGVWVGLEHDAEQRVGPEGILECFLQGEELLGEGYGARVVSVHDPDEYLAAALDDGDRAKRLDDVVGAYRSLGQLKERCEVAAIGVGAKDWRVIRELAALVELDWVMFACSLTVKTHPPELVAFMAGLHERGVGMINSAVFHSGFLTGGSFFDYQPVRAENAADRPLFRWRERFFALCAAHRVSPAHACVRFALSPPGVVAVALNTSRSERVGENVEAVQAQVPDELWLAMKNEGLMDPAYPHLG